MIKSVVIALIYFLVFVGFNCNGFSTKLGKLLKIVDLMTSSGLNTRERPCEEHMWKFKSQRISRVTHDMANL